MLCLDKPVKLVKPVMFNSSDLLGTMAREQIRECLNTNMSLASYVIIIATFVSVQTDV